MIDITEEITKAAEVPRRLKKYERMMQNREKELHTRKTKRRSGRNENK